MKALDVYVKALDPPVQGGSEFKLNAQDLVVMAVDQKAKVLDLEMNTLEPK